MLAENTAIDHFTLFSLIYLCLKQHIVIFTAVLLIKTVTVDAVHTCESYEVDNHILFKFQVASMHPSNIVDFGAV